MPPPLFSHLFIVEFSCVCVLEKSLSAKLSHSRLCLLLNGRRHFRAARKTLHICFWFSFSGGPAFFFYSQGQKEKKKKKNAVCLYGRMDERGIRPTEGFRLAHIDPHG